MEQSAAGEDGTVLDLSQQDPRSPARSPATRPRDPHRSPLKGGWLRQPHGLSIGPKKTKPRGKLWHPSGPFRRGDKKNASHYWAHCMPCEANDVPQNDCKVAGIAGPMKKHLQKCEHAGPEHKALLKSSDDDGEDENDEDEKPDEQSFCLFESGICLYTLIWYLSKVFDRPAFRDLILNPAIYNVQLEQFIGLSWICYILSMSMPCRATLRSCCTLLSSLSLYCWSCWSSLSCIQLVMSC